MQKCPCSICPQAVQGTGGCGRPGVGCWRQGCLELGIEEGSVLVCSKSPASEVGGATDSMEGCTKSPRQLRCCFGTQGPEIGCGDCPWLFCGAGSVLALCCAVVVTGGFHTGSLSDPVCIGLVLGSE